jgi:murein DD-endopeptidase MepM/ murein hydrolase activator NlpD
MMRREKLERAIFPALVIFAAAVLCACSTSPRTELSWDVREHRTTASNTFYGPRSVTLPPVQRKAAPTQAVTTRRLAAIPTPKPHWTPAWYTPAPPPAAPHTDDQPVQVADGGRVQFRWPLAGRILIDFGTAGSGERNDGINIAAVQGAQIRAAAAGTVSYCGNELKGYGNLVLIQHDDGYITAYAHVSSILVNRSDRVAAGQVIATAGATGDVSSPQLHFEIRHDKRPIDPKALLPKGIVVASN